MQAICFWPDALTYSQMSSNLLVVDVGNSNVVLGVYRDDDLLNSWRLATARERTADEYGILVKQLTDGTINGALEGVIVSSVGMVAPSGSAGVPAAGDSSTYFWASSVE